MPQEPDDDGLVPPVKVLRRRLNGVYRAEGFRGPTRRYVLMVALLVGLASLPTLAAITAGSNKLSDGTTGAMDVPLLPLPSSGPVVPILPDPPPSAEPGGGDPSSGAGPSAAEPEKPKPGYAPSPRPARSTARPVPHRRVPPAKRQDHRYEWGWLPKGSGERPVKHGGSGKPVGSPKPGGSTKPGASSEVPEFPVVPDEPVSPDEPGLPPVWSGQPPCHDRGKCGTRPHHHHRPDFSRHKHCADATHRPYWSHHRDGDEPAITVDIEPSGRHGRRRIIHEQPGPAAWPRSSRDHRPDKRDRAATRGKFQKLVSSIVVRRSSDRSATSRRSSVAERQYNVRSTRSADRTHNSRRYAEVSRPDEPQSGGRSYRGHHRAERRQHDGQHRADESWAVSHHGRHHAGQPTRQR